MSNFHDHFIAYIAKTSGRDKVMRVIQFFMRFIKGILMKTRDKLGEPLKFQSIIKKLDILSSNLSNTRRLLRFGRTLQYQVNLAKLIKAHKNANLSDPFDKYSYFWAYVIPHGLSDLMTILQFYLDHYLYLHKLGIFNHPKAYKMLNWVSDWSWFWDIVLCIYYSFFEIFLMKKKIHALKENKAESPAKDEARPEMKENAKEIAGVEKRIGEIKLDIAKLSFDLPVSYYYIDDKFSHILWIGLTGTISSAVGAYQAW